MSILVRGVASITRRYPLLSGTGAISVTRPFRDMAQRLPDEVWVTIRGAKFYVPTSDLVGRAMYFFGDLDPKLSALVKQCLKPGDCALDIGCNLGLLAVKMAQSVGPSGQVHAFEPAPRMIGYLRKVMMANPTLPITLHEFALGSEETRLDLIIPRDNAGHASLVASQDEEGDAVTVAVKRLSDVAKSEGFDRVDFIKIDVEGFEAQVLEGASEMLDRLRPKFILFEEHGLHHSRNFPRSMTLLFEKGYRIFAIARSFIRPVLEEVTPERPVARYDYIAVSDEGFPVIAKFVKR